MADNGRVSKRGILREVMGADPKASTEEILEKCRKRVQKMPVGYRRGLSFTADDVHKLRYEERKYSIHKLKPVPLPELEQEPITDPQTDVYNTAAGDLMAARAYLRACDGDEERAREGLELVIELRK